MHVVFLGARLPLTKTFAMQRGVMHSTPYPREANVTSYHEEIDSLPQFRDKLIEHAEKGHCLFGGQLTHPLQNESRRGKTKKTLRDWIVFDFDKVQGKDAEDVIKTYLPPECHSISYVVQHSASMFLPDNTSWSGHIFMKLKTPQSEQQVKKWFEYLNFNIPALEKSISLSDSLQALHWPLDRTVAYNSKLIFIAPPKCYGFEPNDIEPISFVRKRRHVLDIPDFLPIDNQTIRQKINQLRRDIGEDEITYDTVLYEGHEMLRQTDVCQIHGLRHSGDHYIRFNMNGGDSYAYFIDLRNPDIIRNFKGEPYLKTQDAAPDLYKALRKSAPTAIAKPPLNEGTDVLAFYATNRDSKIKIGLYDAIDNRLEIYNASETSARAWLNEYGLVQRGPLPHISLIFDPTTDMQYIPGSTEINTFRATKYMTQKKSKKISTLGDVPPLLDRTMRSMLGNPTDQVYTHFLNWLAYIFVERKQTGTAWITSGRTGTGKGSFIKYILTPLFGPEHVSIIQFNALKRDFNEFLEGKLFVVCEEAELGSVDNQDDLMARIRHYITDSPVDINRKQVTSYPVDNFSNWILNSNKRTVVQIPKDDRRFNIAEYQNNRLIYTPNEFLTLQSGAELEAFADVLLHWPIDAYAVTQLIDTDARASMHEHTTSINQLIAEAIIDGNLQFFLDNRPSEIEANAAFDGRFNTLGIYNDQVDRYLVAAQRGEQILMKEEELFALFRTLIPDNRYFQDSKTWRRRHYRSLGLEIDKVQRVPGNWKKRERGILVSWQLPEDAPKKPAGKVVDINQRGKR